MQNINFIKERNRSAGTSLKYRMTILTIVGVLQGCSSLAPGHGSLTSSDGSPPSTDSDRNWANFSETPESLIVPITPEVVRTMKEMRSTTVPTDVSAFFEDPVPYTIGPGDVVGIVVYDHPELMPSAGAVISQQVDPTGISSAPGLIVNASGEISFPYVGRVKIGGLTEVLATELLSEKLKNFIQSPQVTLRIQSFRSRRAYVEGDVRQPGMQIFTDLPMTLPEAINRAGGITDTGDRSNITLTRDGRSVDINLAMLQTIGVDINRILLHNGDSVLVRSRDESKVYVMGEILRPEPVLMRNGLLSLGQALGDSSGINPATANSGQIYVIRRNADGSPSVFHLDARNPMMLALADGFELKPRDVIYVDPVPLVRWNRVISLILPSATVINTGSQIQSR